MLYCRRGDNMDGKKRVRTKNQINYQKRYNNDHVSWRKVSFNDKNPDDMILAAWIDAQKELPSKESTSAYIKRLVREDMERRSKDPV